MCRNKNRDVSKDSAWMLQRLSFDCRRAIYQFADRAHRTCGRLLDQGIPMFQSVIDDFPPVRNRRPVVACLWQCYRNGNQAARCSSYDRISGSSYYVQRDPAEGAEVLEGILLTKVKSQELINGSHHLYNHLVKGP